MLILMCICLYVCLMKAMTVTKAANVSANMENPTFQFGTDDDL